MFYGRTAPPKIIDLPATTEQYSYQGWDSATDFEYFIPITALSERRNSQRECKSKSEIANDPSVFT